jgi:hypothetical protein
MQQDPQRLEPRSRREEGQREENASSEGGNRGLMVRLRELFPDKCVESYQWRSTLFDEILVFLGNAVLKVFVVEDGITSSGAGCEVLYLTCASVGVLHCRQPREHSNVNNGTAPIKI